MTVPILRYIIITLQRIGYDACVNWSLDFIHAETSATLVARMQLRSTIAHTVPNTLHFNNFLMELCDIEVLKLNFFNDIKPTTPSHKHQVVSLVCLKNYNSFQGRGCLFVSKINFVYLTFTRRTIIIFFETFLKFNWF